MGWLDPANPPARTIEEQKLRFKEYVHYHNFERPHEAIGQEYPGKLFTPSPRSWSGKLKSPEYPDRYEVRKVRSCGKISWRNEEIHLGRALEGEPIGVEGKEDGQHNVYFGPIILGFINWDNEFKRPENPGRRRKRIA